MFGINKPKIITDENKINEVLDRGTIVSIAHKEEFRKKLLWRKNEVLYRI